MKDIVHASLLVESIFKIASEKLKKYVCENPIFLRVCVEIHIPLVLKGLNFGKFVIASYAKLWLHIYSALWLFSLNNAFKVLTIYQGPARE